jgi:predicted nucleic acid-binding protein
MEPDTPFSLKDTTPRSSKTALLIGGVNVYVYGVDEAQQRQHRDVAVLYTAHGRGRDYLVSEAFAHEVLHQYRRDGAPKKAALIAVALDARNHGERTVSNTTPNTMHWDNPMH